MTRNEFTARRNIPFSMGVLLAGNAITDAAVLVDGPDCTFFRARLLAGEHDACSTLLAADGRHRLTQTGLHVDTAVAGHEAAFTEALQALCADPDFALVLATALPMATLTGIDHRRLVAGASVRGRAPVALLTERTVDEDWLDGYSRALVEIAQALDLSRTHQALGGVAVVGHVMDRGEADQTANAAEIRRLVQGAGLQPVSVWLSGGSVRELQGVEEAKWIVALPHGRKAAALLGRRLGVPVVDVDVPFGLDATDRFVRTLAAAAGPPHTSLAEEFVAAEHLSLARRWRGLVVRRLTHRTVGFEGDPALFRGFVELAAMFGMRVVALVATSRPRPGLLRGWEGAPALCARPEWQPQKGQDPGADAELYVAHSLARPPWQGTGSAPGRLIPHGFPSPGWHACADAPFLGYRGALHFVDRLVNA